MLTALAASAMAFAVEGKRTSIDASGYWHLPLASQGKPPQNWTSLEQSLAPEDCGQCHADQLKQWRTSRHAQAFAPGLVGQLLNYDASETAECLQCHAPLAEQRTAFEDARAKGVAHRPEQHGLAAAGNGCGGCHVRQHRRFGPPQRGTGEIGASKYLAPHGGAVRTAFFEASEFCSGCHQFAADLAINGKPLENTFVEWKASPQSGQGKTCQTCHMPDRQHLWRGIHNPAMVASGLTPRITSDADGVRFEVTNTGVGHAFPTYVTPKVIMSGVVLDGAGMPRLETLQSHVIARSVRYDGKQWIEMSDTRLLPEQTASLDVRWNGNDRIRVWLEVIPDHYYDNEVYRELLESLPADSEAARLIAQAKAENTSNRFRLFETDIQRP